MGKGEEEGLTHYVPEHDLGRWKSASKFQSSGSGLGCATEFFQKEIEILVKSKLGVEISGCRLWSSVNLVQN